MDQYRFIAPELRVLDQRAIGRDESHRQGRALGETQTVRKRHHLRLWHHGVGPYAALCKSDDRLARPARTHAFAYAADASGAFEPETLGQTFRLRQHARCVKHLLEIETDRVDFDL